MNDVIIDGELTCNLRRGRAWQTDLDVTTMYGVEYFNKCASNDASSIADALNVCRSSLVQRHYGDGLLVDVGIGSGEFIRHRPNTLGTDINPVALKWLADNEKLADDAATYQAFSFWDVIEHMPDPAIALSRIPIGGFAFFSIPVFDDLTRIRESKHYRPGEHLHYWTRSGFIAWLLHHGFYLLETNNGETIAGRDSIESFAFVKVL